MRHNQSLEIAYETSGILFEITAAHGIGVAVEHTVEGKIG
jgi:hypothetical protein